MWADIAVGAPYDGDGKVFIYRGSDSGIETKPAQVSSPRRVSKWVDEKRDGNERIALWKQSDYDT